MAAKKSFTAQNPALMYISVPDTDNTHTDDTYTDKTEHVYNTQNTDKTQMQHPAQSVQNTQYTHTHPESKSKRLNLLIRPSLHRQAQKIAHMQETSVNDIVNLALSRYIAENRPEIDRYDALFAPKEK